MQAPQSPASPTTEATARAGIRTVEGLLDKKNMRSFPWPQDLDKGIDLVSFVVEDTRATSFVFGTQVRSGPSNWTSNEGRIDVGNHGDYWRSSTLPVFVCAVDDDQALIEDAWSALNQPVKGMSGQRIRCRVDASSAAPHIRMRARVQALAPALSGDLRTPLLQEVVDSNCFTELCHVYVGSSGHLELDKSLGFAEVARWLIRDPDDAAQLAEHCEKWERVSGVLVPIADACCQWSLVWGAELSSMRHMQQYGQLPGVTIDASAPENLSKLFDCLGILIGAAGGTDAAGRAQLIDDILELNAFSADGGPRTTGYLPSLVLSKIRDAPTDSLGEAIETAKQHVYQGAGTLVGQLREANIGQRPEPDEYVRTLLTMIMDRQGEHPSAGLDDATLI